MVVVVGGCSGSVVVDGDTRSDDAGSVTNCDDACARAASTCGTDQADCVTQCGQKAAQSQVNGCGDLNDQLLTCIRDAPDDVVCAGPLVPASCQSDFDQWSACWAPSSGG
jgi:hypothetical protein